METRRGTHHQCPEEMQLSNLEYPKSKKRTCRTRVIKELRKPVRKKELKSRGMVTIPYVKGLSESFSRILKTYRICTAVRPHTTLRNLLVHPKDRM